jgi:hypothetical protein
MIYLPVMKNRMYENKIFTEYRDLFGGNIAPIIEVIFDKINKKVNSFDELLEYYDENLGYQYFIDVFVFAENEYRYKDNEKLTFSFENRKSTHKEYFEMLKKVALSNYGVPVISVKGVREYFDDSNLLVDFVTELQKFTNTIAIRIAADKFQKHFTNLDNILRRSDLFIFDINEESIEPYCFDIEDLNNRTGQYQNIILHSPRKESIANRSFKDGVFTDLIDNSILKNYDEYNFDGVADYLGYKNALPSTGSNGEGSALSLMFDYNQNQFFSVLNVDSKKGSSGFEYVMDQLIRKYEHKLDPDGDCKAYALMKENYMKEKFGNWAIWNYYTMLRYLTQIKKNL